HLYRYMTYPAALTKSAAHWRRTNTTAILGRAKIHHRSRHLQPVNIDRDIELIRFLFGVCDRRPERDFDRPRGALIRSLQHSKSFRDVAPANKIDNQAGFLRRALYVFCHCACFHRLLPSWRGFLDRLVALLRIPLELSRRSELAELVANHVLLHVDGDEFLPVMHGECVTSHFRHNRRSPRPGLVDSLLVGLVQPGDRLDQMIVNERPFFYRSCHSLPVSGFWFLVSGWCWPENQKPQTRNQKLLFPSTHDEPIRALVVPGLVPACRLSPRSYRVSAAGGLTFAAAVRMINRIHRDAAHLWPAPLPSRASGLAQRYIAVLDVTDL